MWWGPRCTQQRAQPAGRYQRLYLVRTPCSVSVLYRRCTVQESDSAASCLGTLPEAGRQLTDDKLFLRNTSISVLSCINFTAAFAHQSMS